MKTTNSKKKCTYFGSSNVLLIHYRYIDDPEAIQQIENGELTTEGCLISEDSPKWEWGKWR